MIRRLIILLILLLFTFSCKKTKPHTLIHDGIQRTYYISYPKNNVDSIPLIINMHGTPSNAWQQRLYSEMDSYALPKNIAVVYPEGINKAWNIGASWENSDADDIGTSVNQTTDGGYIITGNTYSYGNQSEIILLKIDGSGVVQDFSN